LESTFSSPLVSVLMTCYNREDYVSEAIESVLASTYSNFELIIVDDCSTDKTVEIVKDYEKSDSRIKVYQNEVNLGDYPNRIRAASYANGKYLKYLDSDDIIYPHGLAVMVDAVDQCQGLCFGLSAMASEEAPFPIFLTPNQSYKTHFYGKSDLFGRAPGSAIILTSLFRQVGGFSGKKNVGDHELWLALAKYGTLVLFPRDLMWSRTHADQQRSFGLNNKALIMFRHHEIDITALSHDDCPLSSVEVSQVQDNLRMKHADYFFKQVRRVKNWKIARVVYKKMGLSVVDLVKSIVKKFKG